MKELFFRVAWVLGLAGCVAEGPSTQSSSAPEKKGAVPGPVAPAPIAPDMLSAPFHDEFSRDTVGDDYLATADTWHIVEGRLCVENARNHPLWLKKKIPVNARIEVDAVAMTEEGDIKVELWGDGKSFATSSTYSDATSYLAIFGGWKNTRHAFAPIDEHGPRRRTIEVDPGNDDDRSRPVSVGQLYHFLFERKNGSVVRWAIDGVDYFKYADDSPLAGPGHDHFGFNDWQAAVCFDNLTVTPL